MSVFFTDSGQAECVSPTFFNDLLAGIAYLRNFDEDFNHLSMQADHVVIVRGAKTNNNAMLKVCGQLEDCLTDAMRKLKDKEPDVFRRLVEKHPGTEVLAKEKAGDA